MTNHSLINLLSCYGFISKETRIWLQEKFQYSIIPKHRTPVSHGKPAEKIWFIIRGLIKWYYIDIEGKEHIYHFVSENEFTMVERSIYHRETPYTYMKAIENTEVLTIEADDYYHLLKADPSLYGIQNKLKTRHYTNTRKIYRILRMPELERYDSFINNFPHLFLKTRNKLIPRMGNTDLINILNISESTIKRSRSLSRHH